ncbi:hypothetical protein SLEP1_g29564 [Rubroshorea leprosula]|uniref:Reverse transcriptase Ty1/copia-type domain-containing protein n=1 Tax=Rubroshorea leprosula TaxID=152421 RepID=A0AAV5K6H8_9ROSI|nr:hypothetical protein SLEP1_g29564 [Rubroshorea leprosula]
MGSTMFLLAKTQTKLNAIALCVGDVIPGECINCINDAAAELRSLCPNQKAAILSIITHPATAMVAKEVIDQPNANLESLKQDPRIGPLLRTSHKIPSSVINNKSPYECLHGIPPAYDLLKVFERISLLGSCVTKPSGLTSCCVLGTHYIFLVIKLLGTFDELYNALPHASTSSTKDDLPTGNALDNFEPSSTSSSTSSSISPIDVASDIIESTNELVVPSSSHPTRIRDLPNYLHDYHCFPAITSMDVQNAFLNGDLEEEVYMKPPPRFNHPPNKTTRGMVLLLLYVDNMIITKDDIASVEELKQFLSQKFEMKDLGVLSYFLGLEVTSSNDGYLLSQVKYASDLVSKAKLNDNKSVSTPLEPNVKLTPYGWLSTF